jgi:GTP pyrophosphokinase
MHRTAEYGIAAHWRYKEGGRSDQDFERKLSWLRQVLEWEQDYRDPREFMQSLKIDLFDDEVFVFTPKGDVVDLPAGATSLDFAYRVHTDVGHRCVGAKINGRIMPLDYRLKNGDIVEILTNKGTAGPSLDWLNIVETPSAKNRIKAWFKRQRRDDNISRGKEFIEKELKRVGLDPKALLAESVLLAVAERYSMDEADDLYAAVGYGGLSTQQVVTRLKDEAQKQKKTTAVVELPPEEHKVAFGRPTEGVRVRGIDNALLRLAKCCNPVPGDPIIGYITRGRGVSVHRLDCPNMVHYSQEPGRLIEVAWDKEIQGSYPVDLIITTMDRAGLLSEVLQILADSRVNILSAKANVGKDRRATIGLSLEIRNLGQLQEIVQKVKRIKDVIDVNRVSRIEAHRDVI